MPECQKPTGYFAMLLSLLFLDQKHFIFGMALCVPIQQVLPIVSYKYIIFACYAFIVPEPTYVLLMKLSFLLLGFAE